MIEVQAPLPRSGFRVSLPVFEGPIDVLLTLIQRASLDIGTVALARVTDSFLQYVAALNSIDGAEIAAFCDVAATLMVIKSRALLPAPEGEAPDEEADAAELIERLHAYRRLRRAAEDLGAREAAGLRAYARVAPAPVVDAPPPPAPADATADALAAAFRSAMAEAKELAAAANLPVGSAPRPHPVRLGERFIALRGVLLARGRLTFRDAVLDGCPPGVSLREFVIVSFLAVLEMLRRWAITVEQPELFGEIYIEAQPGLADVPVPGEHATLD
ncbi:MAG: segregation/condensation protein A [Ardenticatenales bacterium]|nr:segregation/condensation protein A [Ardenticatenales bacterium]